MVVFAIMVVSFIVGIPLALILTASIIEILFIGSLCAVGIITAGYTLLIVAQLVYREIRQIPDASMSQKLLYVGMGIATYITVWVALAVIGSIPLTVIVTTMLEIQSSLFSAIYTIAISIGMPLALVYVGTRKLMTQKKMLPPLLVNTNFLERRKLRTSKGAIQRYLLDQITDAEKQSLESVDELLIKARLAVKLSREFVAKLRVSVNQERGNAPGYLTKSYDQAQGVNQSCLDSLAQLEDYRATVVAYFDGCKDRVKGINKQISDQKLIADFQGFKEDVKHLPQEVDEKIAKTSQEILDSAKDLEKSLKEIRSKAEIDATIAELPDASMESLEKLEETISKCVDLEVPKDESVDEDIDEQDEDLN